MIRHLFPKLKDKSPSDFLFAGFAIGFIFAVIIFVLRDKDVINKCAEKGHAYKVICTECNYISDMDSDQISTLIKNIDIKQDTLKSQK